MNPNPNVTRFHDWLAGRAPRSAPPGLLARSMAELEGDSRRRVRWGWPLSRSVAFAPAVATVAALALVVALVIGFLPERPPPVAEGSSSATDSASAYPSETPSTSPSGSPGASPSTTPSGVPSETAAPSPVETVTPEPRVSITFRLILASVPADTQSFSLDLGGFVTPPWPAGMEDGRAFYFCGGDAHPAPCAAGTYEWTASWRDGYVPVNWYLSRITTAGHQPVSHGYLVADNSTVVMRYPTVSPSSSPGASGSPAAFSCLGERTANLENVELSEWSGDYLSVVDMCLYQLEILAQPTAPAAGTVTVTVDGWPIWSMDLVQWDSTGVAQTFTNQVGRLVTFSTPIPLRNGQVVGLTFTDCPDCGQIQWVNMMGWLP